MKIMGVEFAASNMHYVVIELAESNKIKVVQLNKLVLGETRSRDALVAFQRAVSALLNLVAPTSLASRRSQSLGKCALTRHSSRWKGSF